MRGSFSAHFINLAALRHPISADLFIEKTVPGTKAILLRLLGGLDYWRYGAEELAHACRKHGVTLAVLSGDGRADPAAAALHHRRERTRCAGPASMRGRDAKRRPCHLGADGEGEWRSDSRPHPRRLWSLPEFGVYREPGGLAAARSRSSSTARSCWPAMCAPSTRCSML